MRKQKLKEALTEKKITHFRMRKSSKQWLTRCSVIVALAGGTGLIVMMHPEWKTSVVHALTLPSGSTQIGTIGKAPVIQTNKNSFSTMQPLFDSLIGTTPADYIVGDTHDGTGGKAIGWHSNTSYAGTPIAQADTLVNGAHGLSYHTIHYGMGVKDGFQDTDKFNYVRQGESVQIHNVGTAYNVKTGKNVSVGLELRINNATYYDSRSAQTTRNVFADGYRLLLGVRNNGGTLTIGSMVSMDGIANPGTGQGSEGGGTGGGSGQVSGAASGITASISVTPTFYDMTTKQNLPENSLVAMKVSDIDAGQSVELGQGVLGYILSKPTNLEIKNNILTAKGMGTVVGDNGNLNPNSYIALYKGAGTTINLVNTLGNQGQGSQIMALFGNLGSTSVRQPLGYIEVDKSTLQYGKNLPNNLYGFNTISFDVLDKDGKKVDTLTLNASGKSVKSKGLPAGTYTLRERSSKWSSTGQTVLPDITVQVKANQTTTATPKNTAVTGQITIKKSGVESGNAMWNENYTLEGTTFKLTSKTDGKTYTATIGKESNGEWKALVDKLPLGTYLIEETKASPGFTNTFEKKEVTLSYKDQHTEIVFGTTQGTNQEVKGENTLQKTDKDTGTDQHGKGVLKTAQYAYFHGDDSTGSSPHKTGDPVKWSEKPNPKLLAGEKVTSAVIGGEKVDFGDNVVIDVDDESLTAALGNLASGIYYAQEANAGEGYVTDPTKHYFEIKKQDDKTQIIVTPNTESKEQLIEANITINKMATLPDGQGGAGENNAEFTATALPGTVAEDVIFKTGVHPITGDDGYASQKLPYGDWKLTQTKGFEGYEKVKPIYIHMETDTEKDLLTISASYNEDFSNPYTIRTYSLKDSSTSANPNGGDSVGEVTPDTPTISLSPLHFNDQAIVPKVPSLDVEKANNTTPNPGDGNHKDKPNNMGDNDHDTKETAFEVKPDEKTPLKFRGTNNGTEALTHLKPVDKTIEGKVSIKNMTWTYKGEKLSFNKDGELTTSDGQLLVLQPNESIIGQATLPALPENTLHGDEITLTGVGVDSKQKVGDSDLWFGKTKAEMPGIDVEKADTQHPASGDGDHKDKPNNVGDTDHDTKDTAKVLDKNKATDIFFTVKIKGTEPLSHIKIVDKTIEGKVDVKKLEWRYKGEKLSINKDGELRLANGRLLVAQPDDVIEGKGVLEGLPAGALHGDKVSVEGIGVHSGKKVSDDDSWYGKVKAGLLPHTGEQTGRFLLAGVALIFFACVATQWDKIKALFNKKQK